MNHSLRCVALLLLGCAVALPAWAQRGKRAQALQAAARGEMLAQSCFACHGPRGASDAAAVPSIGGQGGVYLVTAMMRFKEDKRPASVMNRIAKGYSDAEIMEMAQYLARQPFARGEQLTDASKVELGARAYRKVCADCHLDSGRDATDADYPILAGQRLLYMQMQMHEIYTSGRRKVDAKFAGMLNKLSANEIEAVLHYFAAQR